MKLTWKCHNHYTNQPLVATPYTRVTCWISLAQFFSSMHCWVLIFALSLFCILIYMFWRWCIDKLGVFHANQTPMCLDPRLNWNRFKPSSKIVLLTVPRSYFFCGLFVFFVSCVFHAFASVHCCRVVTCWERADFLALVGDVYCIFVTFLCGIPGQVLYLIVSFPDLCRLSYLYPLDWFEINLHYSLTYQ